MIRSAATSIVGTSAQGKQLPSSRVNVAFRKEIYPAPALTPEGTQKALARIQDNIEEATAGARTLPINGGVYFPDVTFAAGVALTIGHGLQQRVAWWAVAPRPGIAGTNGRIVELEQNASLGTLTLSSNENSVADIWIFPKPTGGGPLLEGPTVPTPATGGVSISYDQGLIVAPPLAAAWTLENPNATTHIVDSGKVGFPTVFFSAYDLVATSQNTRLALSPIAFPGGGAAYAVVTRFRAFPTIDTSSPICGLFIENAAGKIITMNWQFSGFTVSLQVLEWTNYTTLSGAAYSVTTDISPIASSWFLFEHVTGSPGARNFYWSNDGVNFLKFYTQADTAFINNNETKIGLEIDQNGSVGAAMILESYAQDVSIAALIANGKIAPLAVTHP